jgi:hypothetical protein
MMTMGTMTEKRPERLTEAACKSLYEEAHAAGMKAGTECRPMPMRVEQHANMMDDNSPVVKSWNVPDGPCGFAWVNLKPARGRFASWCKKNGKGKPDSYYGGLTFWVREFGQSLERKEKYAGAFAKVLRDKGMNAYSMSRMD